MKPLITDQVLDQIENDMGRNQPWGPWRRTGLAFLTRSGSQLIEAVEDERDAAVAIAYAMGGIKDYAEKLRQLADLMDKASTRLRVALCWRDDCNDILKEAETE